MIPVSEERVLLNFGNTRWELNFHGTYLPHDNTPAGGVTGFIGGPLRTFFPYDLMSFWHHIPFPIIGLAPMDGVTDAAFRHIVARHGGPDVIFTEFTNVMDLHHGNPKAFEALRYSAAERPIVAQLYGKDPDLFYQAAHLVCELGFDGLDINMGCPSKNVASSGSGAGLIKTPALALQIMAATRQGIHDWAAGQSLKDGGISSRAQEYLTHHHIRQHHSTSQIKTRQTIPLTVKTRLGYDSVIIAEWSQCLAEGQPEVISIHGRTLSQMYRGEADWEAITQVTRNLQQQGILVLGNGDIKSLPDAIHRIHTSGVDGVLIGRAALGNPWIFQEVDQARAAMRNQTDTGWPSHSIGQHQRLRMALEHAMVFETLQPASRFPRMRKHLGWYCTGFPHAASLRAKLVKSTGSEDVARMLAEFQTAHAPLHLASSAAGA